MNLYFLRHGLAADRETWEEEDALRPLTGEGRDRIEKLAGFIANQNLSLDRIVSSPYLRALQTAEIVAKANNLMDQLVQDERLAYDFNAKAIGRILADNPELKNIMFVGHEPTFSMTIGELTGGRVVCKKGSLARVHIIRNSPLQGELDWLVTNKIIRGAVG
jgi:phosphohistidine phosphatase